MHTPHTRWQPHNRTRFVEQAINAFLALTLLASACMAFAIVVYILAGALALLRYAFGA